MLNEEDEISQYLNDVVSENEDSDSNGQYIDINDFFLKNYKNQEKETI